MLSKKFLLIAVVVAYIGYRAYHVPVPKSTSEPYKLRLALLLRDIEYWIIGYLDYVGLIPDYKAIRWLRQVTVVSGDGVHREDTMFDGVPVRVYRPSNDNNNNNNTPAMVYYHGGGWVLGSVDSYDALTAEIAQRAAILVVSVEYRLVPEHDKNDGLADCVRATKYLLENGAARYGVDPERILIAGDSAGGNYAAAVALRLRDESFAPAPSVQLLIYPSVQAIDLDLPSHQQNGDGPFLSRSFLAWFLSYACCHSNRFTTVFLRSGHVPYDVRTALARAALDHDRIPNEYKYPPYRKPDFRIVESELWSRIGRDYLDPYYFPLMANDHGRLPKAYVITAHHDVLRDEGYLYAEKLRRDGTDVTYYNCPYCWHGILNGIGKFKDADKFLDKLLTFVKENI